MDAIDGAATDRTDPAVLLGDIERIEAIFSTWEEAPRAAVLAYRRALEAINAEALRRLVRALTSDPAAFAALRGAAGDEVVYAVLRRHAIVKASLNERVEVALESVRPMLASHGGDVELVEVAPPAIAVRFLGACDGCAASALTFHAGVKTAVQEACPEITEIRQMKGIGGGAGGANFVSPFALDATGNWLAAGSLSEIPEDGVRAMQVGGERVILWRRGGTVSCFRNACAHLGLAIDDGEVADGIITCTHHGFRYDLATGECLTASEVQLQPHAVRIVGRHVEVRLAT